MSGTSAAAGSGDAGAKLPRSLKQRHKRARTGCERCRAQHRKCDEEKPKCRRCADAGAVCKYITHISFLDKNSQTSSAVTSRASFSSTARECPVLEFVVNDDFSARSRNDGSPPTFMNTECPSQFQDQRISHGMVLETRPVENIVQVLEDGGHSLRKDIGSLEKDELKNTENLSFQGLSPNPPRDPNRWNNSWPLVGRSSLSDEEVVLLKYYSHHVAPWLDVYDPSQPFRHLVTRLAMDSPCVLEGILHLSAASSGRPLNTVRRRGVGPLHLQAMSSPLDAKSPFSTLRLIISFVLVRTLLFVQAVPESWEAGFDGGGIPTSLMKYKFIDADERSMWISMLVLIARLANPTSPRKEIAYSLMNQTAPIAISGPIRQILSPPNSHESIIDPPQKPLDASLHCLGLLADVMNFCLPALEPENHVAAMTSPSATPTSVGISASRTTKWKALLTELCAWQTHRPPELQPLLELEASDPAFPTLIYASGAGTSSNALHHAAMHILLSHKPSSLSLADLDLEMHMHGDSGSDSQLAMHKASLSPLWHARRVCGIALHSEPEDTKCWDPCLIAALALVARRITHPAQQGDILACLGRVGGAGWNIEGVVKSLSGEWGVGG